MEVYRRLSDTVAMTDRLASRIWGVVPDEEDSEEIAERVFAPEERAAARSPP